jgi:hypothetical protein
MGPPSETVGVPAAGGQFFVQYLEDFFGRVVADDAGDAVPQRMIFHEGTPVQ